MTNRETESIIRAFAARQQGVVARRQLLAAGVSRHGLDNRLKDGRLHRLFRGVYRAGPVPARYEREMAAVLASGEGAVLSHGSAAALWRIAADPAGRARVEVTVERRYRLRTCHTAVAHRTASLAPEDRTSLRGIPVTRPTRTLLDIAPRLPTKRVATALDRALRKGLTTPGELISFLERFPRRPGRGCS